MSALRFAPLVFKQVIRHRVRTVLTLLGIATAMFLFTSVQAMQRGVAQATQATAADTQLVVYRKDRFCPATSALPQDYAGKIGRIEGVRSVVPVKIVVTNCRTSLDVVTFRGVPKESFLSHQGKRLRVVSGSIDDWMRRTDASLLGRTLAERRGLKPGMTFDAAGITTYVAAVVESDDPQDQNAAYTALEFVQLAGRNQLGIVTQFNVQVADPAQLEAVAQRIDEHFTTAQEPTATTSEKAFIARVAHDIVELVGFARWLGIGCLIAVLALVGNAIVLSVQSRVAEHAILQTLGFTPTHVAALIVAEGVLTALLGGLLGAALAIAVAQVSSFALSVEGQSIPILATPALLASGLAICTALGVAAGLAPAWQAGRRSIVSCFRTV
jgi:putative ABC transport system permease protein